MKSKHCIQRTLWNLQTYDNGISKLEKRIQEEQATSLDLSHTPDQNVWKKFNKKPLRPAVLDLVTRYPQITELSLRGCWLSEAGPLVPFIQENKTLTHLDVSDNEFTEAAIHDILVALVANTTLHSVDFSKSRFSEQNWLQIADVITRPECALRQIILSDNPCGDTAATRFIGALARSHLTQLDLSRTGLSKAALKQLTDFLCAHPQQIRELDLTGITYGDELALALTPLLQHPECKLERLTLNQCQLTAVGLRALSEGLVANTSLRVLCLQGAELTEEGIQVLAAMIPLQNTLRALDLSGTHMTETMMEQMLDVLVQNTSLCDVRISSAYQASSNLAALDIGERHYKSPAERLEIKRNQERMAQCHAEEQRRNDPSLFFSNQNPLSTEDRTAIQQRVGELDREKQRTPAVPLPSPDFDASGRLSDFIRWWRDKNERKLAKITFLEEILRDSEDPALLEKHIREAYRAKSKMLHGFFSRRTNTLFQDFPRKYTCKTSPGSGLSEAQKQNIQALIHVLDKEAVATTPDSRQREIKIEKKLALKALLVAGENAQKIEEFFETLPQRFPLALHGTASTRVSDLLDDIKCSCLLIPRLR
jgi:Ran GTPase-activating protein (RanGAP) involved in mRNA processing and transport